MPRCPTISFTCIRAIVPSEWQDCGPLRWAAQLAAGALPGVIICMIIMKLAITPAGVGSGAHPASIVPLLSTSAVIDTAAFHRLKFTRNPGADSTVHFRRPGVAPATQLAKPIPPASPLPVDFNAPRTGWQHLDPATRDAIDAGLARGKGRTQIVLHGSHANHGNARLLDRYRTAVCGEAAGQAYHFVIGNGNDAKDGQIEASERWSNGQSGNDASIHVCFVGDFDAHAPSDSQLRALDELRDYLTIKLGEVSLTIHRVTDSERSSCLGRKFPAESLGRR